MPHPLLLCLLAPGLSLLLVLFVLVRKASIRRRRWLDVRPRLERADRRMRSVLFDRN